MSELCKVYRVSLLRCRTVKNMEDWGLRERSNYPWDDRGEVRGGWGRYDLRRGRGFTWCSEG